MNEKELFRNAERRQEVRVAAHVDVKFQGLAEAAKALKTFSVNFSAGGLCMRTRAVHAVGDRLKLSVAIAEEVFELEGVVAWAKADVFGIRFVDVSAAARTRLEQVARVLAVDNPIAP